MKTTIPVVKFGMNLVDMGLKTTEIKRCVEAYLDLDMTNSLNVEIVSDHMDTIIFYKEMKRAGGSLTMDDIKDRLVDMGVGKQYVDNVFEEILQTRKSNILNDEEIQEIIDMYHHLNAEALVNYIMNGELE